MGLRRAVAVLVGLLCAGTLAFIVLPLAIILDPQIHSPNPGFLIFGFLALIFQANDPERLAASVMFVWTAMLTVCLLPLAFSAIIGELVRLRAWLWYACATGFVAAGLPLMLRVSLSLGSAMNRSVETTAIEHRLLLLFFLTGVLSGSLYWLIAGRSTGGTPANGSLRPPEA